MNILKKLFRRPPQGEQTRQQGIAQAGIGIGQLPGLMQPHPGTYALYRRMSAHPTLALAKSIVTAPILSSSWTFETRRPDGRKPRRAPMTDGVLSDPLDRQLHDRANFIQRQLDPMRTPLLVEALRALEFGWRPFEKIYEIRDHRILLKNLKPLLPDFTFVQVDNFGHFAGLIQMDTQLGPEKSFIYTHDGEAGNLYGRSRHENARQAWSAWNQVDERTAQLAAKVAAIVPLVHYPLGQSRDAAGQTRDNGDLADVILTGLRDAAGQTRDNGDLADVILTGLGSGRGVKLPNLFANSEDPRQSADLAGKSSWVISFLEATHASANIQSLTDRQRYYDVQMFRAWLRPERTGLESRYGSRADAHRHSDTAITDSELLHSDICSQLTRNVIDDLLLLNYGHDAIGSVYLSPAPLQESKRELLAKLLESIWKNPTTLDHFLSQADMNSIFEIMELPQREAAPSSPVN